MKTINIQINRGKEEDLAELKNMLQQSGLPFNDLPETIENFMFVRDNEKMIGCGGLELYGRYGLLRSMVTDPTYRNKGVAHLIQTELVSLAGHLGLDEVFLLTNSAESFFEKRGFRTIERTAVPDEIKNSTQFSSSCPSSAVLMHLEL